MRGAPDPLYVAARRVLLDALTALGEQLDAIVLVGAQAVYLRADEADLHVAPFTTDADLAIDPRRLLPEPLLEMALRAANFLPSIDQIGIWESSVDVHGHSRRVTVDLLVPETLSGGGRRAARIPPHGPLAARKVSGLEGVLVDNDQMSIGSLESDDMRQAQLTVAGPSALLVAKVHKIEDRIGSRDRASDKDALDIYRLLRDVSTEELVRRFALLRSNDISRSVTDHALKGIAKLFGSPITTGTLMAVRAAGPLEIGQTLPRSIAALTQDLLEALKAT